MQILFVWRTCALSVPNMYSLFMMFKCFLSLHRGPCTLAFVTDAFLLNDSLE